MTVKQLLPVTAMFRFHLHLGMRVKKKHILSNHDKHKSNWHKRATSLNKAKRSQFFLCLQLFCLSDATHFRKGAALGAQEDRYARDIVNENIKAFVRQLE